VGASEERQVVSPVLAEGFLSEWWTFLTDADQWSGSGGIPHRTWEHLLMSAATVLVAIVVALPVGAVLGHLRRGGMFAISLATVARAVPTYGLLVIAFTIFGLGPESAFVALVILAIPPILVNTYSGVSEVDDDLRETATGMGMSGRQRLLRVELPVALPLIMAGIRTAAVQVVATATLAAVIAWGGLGRFIVDGIAQQDDVEVFTGAVLVALLAAITEVSLALLERFVVSPGLRGEVNVEVRARAAEMGRAAGDVVP
jgi:osmoprotectant transport system permease protein